MIFKILFIFGVLFSILIYRALNFLDYFKKTENHHYQNCQRLSIDLPTEDLVVFGDHLIGATADSNILYHKQLAAHLASPGFLVAINPRTKETYKIKTHNFPSNIQMNSHGMSLYKDTLYVISHEYYKGGEIVILFRLEAKEKIEAYYLKHIHLGDSHGVHNSIAVYDDNQFFITEWLPIPDPPEGKDLSLSTTLYRSFLFFWTQSTGVKLCRIVGDSAECEFKTRAYSANGINLNGNSLYVTDCAISTLYIYSVSDTLELNLTQEIKLSHNADNIHYHNNSIYVTGILRKTDLAKLIDNEKRGLPMEMFPAGVSRVDLKENVLKVDEIIMQDIITFATASAIVEDKLVMSSVSDPALLICTFPQ